MIRTNTPIARTGRIAGIATAVIAPVLFLPSPYGFRPADPLQSVAVSSARDAVASSQVDHFNLEHALLAAFGRASGSRPDGGTPPAPSASVTGDSAVSAYAAISGAIDPARLIDPGALLGDAAAPLRDGIDAYRRGDVAAGDAIASRSTNPLVATVLSWTWLRTHPREAGVARITRFIADHPDWPGNEWLRKRVEDAMYADHLAPAKVRAWFAARTPATVLGRIALARALQASGDIDGATKIIRAVWARDDLAPFAEAQLRKQFGEMIGPAEYKLRADHLTYKEDEAGALRIATQSGDKDLVALEKIRAAAQNGPLPDKLLATVPSRFANDPGLRFAKIQVARRANKIDEAATLMLDAPRDPAALVDPDEWWTERRLIARKLLDANEPERAYRICAEHSAASAESRMEAEFHAGWIALRFLNDPARAKPHFANLAGMAQTPVSKARAAYWQGRAAEAAREPADGFYTAAATYPSTFYGQLAAARLSAVQTPTPTLAVAEGEGRSEAVRAVEALYLSGAKDLAVSLATEIARYTPQPEQVRALARVVGRDRDAKVSLAVGKLAGYRGIALDDLAFPTYGVPDFAPLPNSASLPLVYAIARQESAFDPNALSGAGAMGLMQMIVSTAKRTAQRAGLAFDALKMRSEPAFNAQLGAAHLGDLLSEHDGSTILTLAAYNAGGKRVKEWIAAYGDPRKPSVDAVDWIERIPFTETRNYVQRVSENLAVYRSRLASLAKPDATPAAPATAPEPLAPPAPTVPIASTEQNAAVALSQRFDGR